ncbi:MAG: arsenite methyltransferase [Nanobdellota archaeon]
MKMDEHKKKIKENYANASRGCGCSCSCGQSVEEHAKTIGYSDDDIKESPEANLGLGCGNPTAHGEITKDMTVLDLGSGGGFDCLLAARKAKKVIGIDMTDEMIEKARENANKNGYDNVEFRKGEIENLPLEDDSVDLIISNCVINLSNDKAKVLKEANRVLRENGSFFVSDMVLLEELSEEQRNDPDLITGCVGNAVMRDEFLSLVKEAGFAIESVSDDKDISEKQYNGLPVESIKITARRDEQ